MYIGLNRQIALENIFILLRDILFYVPSNRHLLNVLGSHVLIELQKRGITMGGDVKLPSPAWNSHSWGNPIVDYDYYKSEYDQILTTKSL